MAQSRLEKVGTIFTRVTGLLRAGAMKPDDKPIWYDVYAAFPPKLEPRFDRPAPNINIRPIFYEEDLVRAKYHKSVRQQETINLSDVKRETQTQQFITIYNGLKAQGVLDDEQIFATALDLLAEKRQQARTVPTEYVAELEPSESNMESNTSEGKPESSGRGVNIQNLFKD